MDSTATKTTTSRRELGKSERRQRIVDAAAALVREAGFDAVSMVQIAERADVSPATVYNLFETKAAIFHTVFDRDLESFQQTLAAMPEQDAIGRLFAAIALAAQLYRRDPEFYRAMARIGRHSGEGLRTAISAPRRAFWREQVAHAVAQGALRPDTDAKMLGLTLSRFKRGIFLDWADGSISAERLGREASYAFASLLLAHATERAAPGLRARLAKFAGRAAATRAR